jgi:hypothetical protein
MSLWKTKITVIARLSSEQGQMFLLLCLRRAAFAVDKYNRSSTYLNDYIATLESIATNFDKGQLTYDIDMQNFNTRLTESAKQSAPIDPEDVQPEDRLDFLLTSSTFVLLRSVREQTLDINHTAISSSNCSHILGLIFRNQDTRSIETEWQLSCIQFMLGHHVSKLSDMLEGGYSIDYDYGPIFDGHLDD